MNITQKKPEPWFVHNSTSILEAKVAPVCYHPTTVVCIDDNPDIHRLLAPILIEKNPVKLFDNATDAINFINAEPEDSFLKRCVCMGDNEKLSQRVAQFDLSLIHQELNRIERFKQISVLVVDYAMPEMSGLEFVQHLQHRDVKIIMLTGEADYSIALDAFNKHLIHRFIRKDEVDVYKAISGWIAELQEEYFIQNSNPVMHLLSFNDSGNANKVFLDKAYIDLVHEVVKQNQIYEYYLVDTQGSYLMLDQFGKQSWLIVRNQEYINEAVEQAKEFGASDDIIHSLASGEKVLFFFPEYNDKIQPNNWAPYLHPAKQLIGQKTYYYSYIPSNPLYQVKIDNMQSFADYLQSIDVDI